MSRYQVDIFTNHQQSLHFAEICNALYERELQVLARSHTDNINLLQRHLQGLSYHIKRAAEHLLSKQTPISVDTHNGSWQYKQASKCMVSRQQAEKTAAWFNQHARMGQPVCVYHQRLGMEHIELDSIDRIEQQAQRLHLNKNGWFKLTGESDTATGHTHGNKQLLLKPSKTLFAAACCGHRWKHKDKTHPRSLSLRELLLSTTINWNTFK